MTRAPIGQGVGADSERTAVVEWLRRRAEMASPLPPRWRPIKRLRYKWMRSTFDAAAMLIEWGAHHSPTLDAETEIIRSAKAARIKQTGTQP